MSWSLWCACLFLISAIHNHLGTSMCIGKVMTHEKEKCSTVKIPLKCYSLLGKTPNNHQVASQKAHHSKFLARNTLCRLSNLAAIIGPLITYFCARFYYLLTDAHMLLYCYKLHYCAVYKNIFRTDVSCKLPVLLSTPDDLEKYI